MSGIFRDVYLLWVQRPDNAIYDYFTTTRIVDEISEITVRGKVLKRSSACEDCNLRQSEGVLCIRETAGKYRMDEYTHQVVLKIEVLN